MRRAHRVAHGVLTLAAAALAATLLASAWSAREARPAPQPFGLAETARANPGEPEWTVVLRAAGWSAAVSYWAGPRQRLRVALPPGLDAAEPGLVLEGDGRTDTLGSVNAVRPWLPAPTMPAEDGRLFLADLARGLRLAEAPLPAAGR